MYAVVRIFGVYKLIMRLEKNQGECISLSINIIQIHFKD